eukprot:49431-Rhodomonas_salina.2
MSSAHSCLTMVTSQELLDEGWKCRMRLGLDRRVRKDGRRRIGGHRRSRREAYQTWSPNPGSLSPESGTQRVSCPTSAPHRNPEERWPVADNPET